jgi:hypothetical protein
MTAKGCIGLGYRLKSLRETRTPEGRKKKLATFNEKIKAKKEELRLLGLKKHHLEGPLTITGKQSKAIELLLDFQNNWPPEYIAAQCGVSTRTIHNWRNDPIFLRTLDKEITSRRTRVRLEAFRMLFKKIKFGNAKFLKMYLELTGDLKQHIKIEDEQTVDSRSEGEVDKELDKLRAELGVHDAELGLN